MSAGIIEVELKISLNNNEMDEILQVLAGRAEIRHKYLPRAYYDTVNMDLYRHKCSLRLQYKKGKSGALGGYEQTVKFEIPNNFVEDQLVIVRKECKDRIVGTAPDLKAITDEQARKEFQRFENKELIHIFTAAIERRSFDWSLGAGEGAGVVEVAFDVGVLEVPGVSAGRQPFSEIEVELKSGNPAVMEVAREKIMALAPTARVQPLSKAEQGARLYLACKK